MNAIWVMLARMLLNAWGLADGKKTSGGVLGMALGTVLYILQAKGIVPIPPPEAAQSFIDTILAYLPSGLFNFGAATAGVGFVHKVYKVKQGAA